MTTATITQVRPTRVRPTRVRPTQARPTQVRPVQARPTQRTRLTRRGRLVVLVTLVAIVLGAFLLGRGADAAVADQGTSGPAGTATATATATGTVTTVRAGETLWAVARRLDPGHDPRALVQRLRSLNGLTTGAVQAGQQLRVPAIG